MVYTHAESTQENTCGSISLIKGFIASELFHVVERRESNESYRFTTLSFPVLADVNFASGRAQSNPSCHVSNNFSGLSKHTVHRSKLLSLL